MSLATMYGVRIYHEKLGEQGPLVAIAPASCSGHKSLRRFAACMCSIAFMGVVTDPACAQAYPSKPIRMITTTPGGGSDFVTRIIAQGITGPLGQPVVVDNRGSGLLAAESVSKAAPDGYTLFVGGSAIWILPLLQKAPYAAADFAPVTLAAREVLILAVHPSLPVKSVKELIALAKAKPAELNNAGGLSGTISHLAVELFKSMAGVNIVSVPYKGVTLALADLMSGDMQMTIRESGGVLPYVKAGRLRALAVTSAEPSALAPGLPAVAATLPGYESVGITGVFAPAGTPQAVISRLNQEIVRVLNRPEVKERFLNIASEIVASSPEEFVTTMKIDIIRVGKVIRDAGIKTD